MRETPVVDKIKQMREPAAAIVELVVLANVVVGIIRVVTAAGRIGWLEAMRSMGGAFMGVPSLLCLLLAVAACVLVQPVTKHARGLAISGFVLALVGAVLALVFLVAGLFASQPGALGAALEAVGGLTDLMLKGLAAFFLLYLARVSPDLAPPRIRTPEPAAVEAAPAVEAEPEARQMPTWGRDQASGARWNTAADAAKGAPPVGVADELEAQPAVAAQPSDPEAPAQVQTIVPEVLDGPPAKADPGLWRRS